MREEIRAAFERRTALADLELDSAHPLLLDALVFGIRRDQDRVLALVALLYPRLALEPLRQAMSQADARLRANAIERLENVAVLGAAGKMGSGIVLLVAIYATLNTYRDFRDNFAVELREFASALREGRQPISSGREVRPVVEVMEACRLSAAERRVVELP